MKLRGNAVLVTVILVTGGVAATSAVLDKAEMGRQRRIVARVSGLTSDCQRSPVISRERRVLVWDTEKDRRSSAQARLPEGTGADAKSNPMAIVLLLPQQTERVGTYAISGQPAYRVSREICVIDWPEKRPIGGGSVVSEEPPHERIVKDVPEFGDADGRIAARIVQWRAA